MACVGEPGAFFAQVIPVLGRGFPKAAGLTEVHKGCQHFSAMSFSTSEPLTAFGQGI
jgi:hypothetical protein